MSKEYKLISNSEPDEEQLEALFQDVGDYVRKESKKIQSKHGKKLKEINDGRK
jgi:ElaB/YqjD/DUF883 family membrane-anchored ribosome-binding protein